MKLNKAVYYDFYGIKIDERFCSLKNQGRIQKCKIGETQSKVRIIFSNLYLVIIHNSYISYKLYIFIYFDVLKANDVENNYIIFYYK